MSTTRDKLSLSSDAASKKNKIPKLKEVELKVRFDISKDTLLTYQYKHNTNTHFLPLKLKLNPTAWGNLNQKVWDDFNEIERHILVNCLNKDIRLSYNYPVNGHNIHEEFTDDLLFEELNDVAERILIEELQFASHLIGITKNDFVPFIVDNTTKIVTNYLDDPEDMGDFPTKMIVGTHKDSKDDFLLKWSVNTDLCIHRIIEEQADKNLDFLRNKPLSAYSWVFIDLNKIPTLACLCGYVVLTKTANETVSFWDENDSIVEIKGDEELLYQHLVKALIEQTSYLLRNITHEPVGFLFDDSVSKCTDDFNTIKNNALDYINKAEKDHKKAKDKVELEYAETLIKVTRNKHLKLTIDQGFYWKPIYFDVLTQSIENDLREHIVETFSKEFLLDNKPLLLEFCHPRFLHYSTSESDPDSVNFWQNMAAKRTNKPSELALLLYASIQEFFFNHTWLSEINTKRPETNIFVQTDTSDETEIKFNGDPVEFIAISNYFVGSPIPRERELIIDVLKFKTQLQHPDDVIPF